MKATAESWKRIPFQEGSPLPFDATLDARQLETVTDGFLPEAMEDKWFIYHQEPHLFFHRSWTGEPVYRVTLERAADGARLHEALLSKSIAGGTAEYHVQLLRFLIFHLLLGGRQPFPHQLGVAEPLSSLFQHHVAGRGHRTRPWWKLW